MAEERAQRRLAAILAADVVGYSRMMEADEQLTRARLRALHFELINPQITSDGGRIVKTMGDGILVEFPMANTGGSCDAKINHRIWSSQGAWPRENFAYVGRQKRRVRSPTPDRHARGRSAT